VQITNLFSFLVHPGKGLDPLPQLSGAKIPLAGSLHSMLNRVFQASDDECRIGIYFVMTEDGSQRNPARDMIVQFIQRPIQANARLLGNRLCESTPGQSGLGLLFLMLGREDDTYKLILSRFPADQGVVAEAQRGRLEVQFIERVFMKNAASYKAALYRGVSFDEDFRTGLAVDKQLRGPSNDIASYWIHGFLGSDFETTSKAGTRRFAVALRDATKSAAGSATKHELVVMGMLAHNLNDQMLSIRDIIRRYSLSDEAATELLRHVDHPGLAEDAFRFDSEEYALHAVYASVELHTGCVLLAPPDKFEQTIEREEIDPATNEYRFSTTGRIVNETVRGRR